MLAFGFFSASKASADVDVTDISLSSSSPGATGQITISFTHESTLAAGSGQIVIAFDATWGVPSTIDASRVTLTTVQTTGGTSNPDNISIVAAAAKTTVTLTIGDTDPSTTGKQNMHANAGAGAHILVFSPLAGISNPTSQGTESSAWVRVTTTGETTATDGADPGTSSTAFVPVGYTYTIARAASVSPTSGTNGTSVTATGKGFVTGTLTAFIDHGADDAHTAAANGHTAASHATTSAIGQWDSGTDITLGTSDAAVAAGTETVTFTASVPTFTAGANNINVMDGLGNADGTPATFTLNGNVTTSKSSVKRGESVVVKLAQYTAGDVQAITFGGAGADLPSTVTISSGALSLTVTVPTTTPLGTQRVAVTHSAESARNTTIEVVGAPMTLSPSTAVPLQTITVSGSGFNGSATVSTITVGNFAVPSANIAAGATVTADDSGNIVAQVKIPIDATDSTTRTAGTYKMTITDSDGRTGQADLVIPSRTVALGPSSSRRASTVTVDGSGFPAATSVTITYGSTTVGSATPDSTGAFSTTITVPTTASIPSTNTITVTSSGSGSPTGTATHTIPGASITVAESSAVSGTQISVTGVGFPGYATMTSLTIGAVSAIPTPAPSTDIDGVFSATVLVPQLSSGTQAVLATIGGISANSSVAVTTAVAATVVTTTETATVFADVISNSDNLVRVWRFDNATQAWSFYDPRDAFASANTLTEASSGNIVWVNVTADQAFQSTTLYAGWNLISLD
jgi:hypothetical protein